MAPSSPSLFLSWKFPETGRRNAVVSRGRWQSKMHASLCSSRGHIEVIKKKRLTIVLNILHSLQTNCRIRLFPVSFRGWTRIFADQIWIVVQILVFFWLLPLAHIASPPKRSILLAAAIFISTRVKSVFNVYWNSDWGIHLYPLSSDCSGNQAKKSRTSPCTFIHTSP